jgi:hypothetical protein
MFKLQVYAKFVIYFVWNTFGKESIVAIGSGNFGRKLQMLYTVFRDVLQERNKIGTEINTAKKRSD